MKNNPNLNVRHFKRVKEFNRISRYEWRISSIKSLKKNVSSFFSREKFVVEKQEHRRLGR